MKWSDHVDSVIKKLSKYVPILYKVRGSLTRESLVSIYNSIIYPHLTYCNSVWGACGKTKLLKLKILQKKIIRAMSFCAHTAPLFTNLKLLKLEHINKYICSIYVYKALANNSNIFNFRSVNVYLTRQSNLNLLSYPNINTFHSRQCVRWTGVEAWNGLPLEIRDSDNINTSKIKTKKFLLNL